MPTRILVFWAFLFTVGSCSPVAGAQAQSPENTRDQVCGRTSCRELAQALTTAVTAATDHFKSSRERLRPHEVYYRGRFSRFVSFVKQLLHPPKQKDTQTVGSTGPQTPPGNDIDTV